MYESTSITSVLLSISKCYYLLCSVFDVHSYTLLKERDSRWA